jgi:F420-0:gamma-glutamyl ligase
LNATETEWFPGHEIFFGADQMAVREKLTIIVTTMVGAASAALAGLRLSNLKDVISYLRPKDFDRRSEGLRKAGLPE